MARAAGNYQILYAGLWRGRQYDDGGSWIDYWQWVQHGRRVVGMHGYPGGPMAAQYSRWERRDNADRVQFATAAFDLCRALRHQGARSSRFYWANGDAIVILTEAEDQHLFEDQPKPELAHAMFALSDLARMAYSERWMDPRTGEETYHIAGR